MAIPHAHKHKCWVSHTSGSSYQLCHWELFLVTLGHIKTRKVLHSHLTSAGLTQEEDKGDKAHKQYSSSCLLPACLPSREIWLQLRREQLGVSWKSRSTGECCQSSGVTGLMEEEEKLSDVAGERGRFVSSRTVMGFIYSAIKNRKERRNDGSERTEHTTLGRDALVLSGVPPHLLPLFSVSPSSPSGSHTRDGAAPLPTPISLCVFLSSVFESDKTQNQ